jgi:ADP-ribose pyrophosphatase
MSDASDDPELTWRVLSRTPVHDYRIFRSLAVRAAHPQTGAERTFTVLDTPDWINVIAITPDQQIVLLRQFRHGAGRVHVEIPGGMVDPGEDHEAAARRELLEETGYTAPRWHHLGAVEPNPAIQGNRLHTWLAEDAVATTTPTPDEGEILAVFTAPVPEVAAMLRDGRIGHALVVVAFAHLALRRPDPLVFAGTPAPTP